MRLAIFEWKTFKTQDFHVKKKAVFEFLLDFIVVQFRLTMDVLHIVNRKYFPSIHRVQFINC